MNGFVWSIWVDRCMDVWIWMYGWKMNNKVVVPLTKQYEVKRSTEYQRSFHFDPSLVLGF